jgi:UDP-N-acetylmuramoylalanine--D-glutamate ligase
VDLKGLNVTVVGISRSGMSAARLLKTMGARVYATDNGTNDEVAKQCAVLTSEGIHCEIGRHTESFVKGKDLVVLSPGVSNDAPVIRWAHEARIPIISELELGYLFCKGTVIAITGTNGKTTTTTLIGEICKSAGRPTVVCGNIGTPFSGEVLNITGEHIVVLEVSSFQLEWIDTFKPHVSVILNVTDDHLDRHRSFDEYRMLKNKIFVNQGKEDYLILNHEDPHAQTVGRSLAPRRLFFSRTVATEGIFVNGTDILLDLRVGTRRIGSTDVIPLHGLHNLENVLASALSCSVLGIPDEVISNTIAGFQSLPHRFQPVAELEGVAFINDSKATNVDSTMKALMSLQSPVVLIAGGRDKASDFRLAKNLIREKVRTLVLIGEATERITTAIGGVVPVQRAGSLREAVAVAYRSAERGDTVLLSPMCASFDMFDDYVERGNVFIDAVNEVRDRLCARSASRS